MTSRYTIQGITDERDACDCCGKSNLKRTVVLLDTESDTFVFFGTTCAARAMKIAVKAVNAGVNAAERAKAERRATERRAAQQAEFARWTAHLVARSGGIKDYSGRWDILRMIEALGGYEAASAGYRA